MSASFMQKSSLLVSVVSPVCNAETWIENYLREVSARLETEYKDYEIVVIDNSSNDETIAIVEALQQELRNIQLYCLARSIPQESAFVVGLEQAIGDVVITLDAAYDPVDCLTEMIQMSYSGVDIVYGLRNDRITAKASLYHQLTKIFYKLYRKLTKEDYPIGASTFRLYSRRTLNSFLDNRDRYSLFPVLTAFSGLRYKTFHYRRINRTGKAFKPNYFTAIARAIRLTLLSSYQPLRLLSVLSLLGAFLNIVYSIYVVLVNLFKSDVAEGWTTLSLQNSVMFFILFTVLAILSEYVLRIFMNTQNRPFYLISSESRSLVLKRKNEINVVSDVALRSSQNNQSMK